MALTVHHDARSYEQALSDSAKLMRDKLHRKIEAGRPKGKAAIEKILTEIPEDQIVPANKLQFYIESAEDQPKQIKAVYRGQEQLYDRSIHSHALGQMTEAVHLPRLFQSHLLEQGEWGQNLLIYNLTELYGHLESKHLVRSVNNQIRGFLSTKYQRRHPAQMLESFVRACGKVNAIPYEAYSGDTKFMVKAVMERVVEPIKDEVLALGVVIHESPFGNGATEVSPFIERMWCTNTAITTTSFRKVHIGGRLSGDISWSDNTHQKDTEAMCSQIEDLVAGQLGEKAIQKLTDVVVQASVQDIEASKFETFLKKELTKDRAQAVIDKYTSADIENLPSGHNRWRASNALSWFAGTLDNPEEAFEVQKLAGMIISVPAITEKS